VRTSCFQIVEYPYRDKAMITEMCGNLYKVSAIDGGAVMVCILSLRYKASTSGATD
jgi:hypothetical protein